MMKLHIEKVICLKLLRKLDKALQNIILQVFWSAKPGKSGLQHCGALRQRKSLQTTTRVFSQKGSWPMSSNHTFPSQIYPLSPTLPEACAGLSCRTLTGEFQGQPEDSACAVWGDMHAHREVDDASVLPLPPSQSSPNLETAIRIWEKKTRYTKHTLSGQEFHSLPPEDCPTSFKRPELWQWDCVIHFSSVHAEHTSNTDMSALTS